MTATESYYNQLLRPIVDYCKAKDIYAIIDWHFVGDNTYDRVAETNAFWSYMAPKFASDSHVLFELFNEPLNTSGGSDVANWLTCRPDMQTWINIIRASAPDNLILVGAPSWSQQVGPAANYPLDGNNIVMVVHFIPAIGDLTATRFILRTNIDIVSPAIPFLQPNGDSAAP